MQNIQLSQVPDLGLGRMLIHKEVNTQMTKQRSGTFHKSIELDVCFLSFYYILILLWWLM